MKIIDSVLVANRGEIARRVFRTATAMGMRCIAVYVDADQDSPHVHDADVAVRLHSTYLDGPAIIAAAHASGAAAIHPGYGFLSENADFAQAVLDAGLIWVGPQPEVIATMGDKLAAKQAAAAAGVPTLPSGNDPADAAGLGFPLLVKAAAGGGGKGMRIVERADDLDDAVASAKREALSGFGDDTVFLERYVPASRHIEIQILGDQHGSLVHLGERECSIQRRHQKIIEEAPSPVVNPAMRAAMGQAALALGNAMGYQSAGTVEFLVDDATREFWFLEVNTRLQVEHPVTEEVTGIDLVRQQLRVAAGELLEHSQDDIGFDGHAIEARLYAEDPANSFLPVTGTVEAFSPAADPAVRWDSGIEPGSVVGVQFDPMLAKVTAHGPTRPEAAAKLALALERLHLGGLVTNRDFLVSTLRHAAFIQGQTTTNFIQTHAPLPRAEQSETQVAHSAIAAALWLQERNRADAPVLRSMPSGFRLARTPDEQVVLRGEGSDVRVRYRRQRDGTFRVGIDALPTGSGDGEPEEPEWRPVGPPGASWSVKVMGWDQNSIDIEVNQQFRTTRTVSCLGDSLHVQTTSGTVSYVLAPRFSPPETEGVSGGLLAPMPGVVLDVRVEAGAVVAKGETLVVLEAMKMEHHMNAPADGVVDEVRVSVGDQVDNGALLVLFEEAETS